MFVGITKNVHTESLSHTQKEKGKPNREEGSKNWLKRILLYVVGITKMFIYTETLCHTHKKRKGKTKSRRRFEELVRAHS